MAHVVGVTTTTLRSWDNKGFIKPAYISDVGHRYYDLEAVVGEVQRRGGKNFARKRKVQGVTGDK